MTSALTSRIIRDEISGKPRTIFNPLLAEHIKVGVYLWHDGYTSVGSWSCPAVITKVDEKKRRFRIRSLDDMIEVRQWYDHDYAEESPTSRNTMRHVPVETVRLYMIERKNKLGRDITTNRKALSASERTLMYYRAEATKLGLDIEHAP